MLIFAERVIGMMGAGAAKDLAVTYTRIMFGGVVLLFFTQVAVALLRSEGDANRAMYAMVGGALLNIVLDPIFIYALGWGVAGAACATVISMFVVSLVAFYWLFMEGKTHVSFRFRGFRFERNVLADITGVGLPVAVSHMSMALTAFALTTIVASVGGPDGVAVYITGWRVISLAVLPMLGVASAVTAVSGAAFGAKEYEKIETSYMYALKLGVVIESVLAIGTFLFAPQITRVFTWSEESTRIVGDLVLYLRVTWVIFPSVAFGMLSSGMFQGVGKGLYSLVMTLIRTLVFTVPLAWFCGVFLEWGLLGVWIGMAAGGLLSIPVAFGWAVCYMRRLTQRRDRVSSLPVEA
jgi:putative MATE family efflux protein